MKASTQPANLSKFQSLTVEPCSYRLSDALVPERYVLDLKLNTALDSTEVLETVEFRLLEPRPFIVLNARNLTFTSARLSGGTLPESVSCQITLEPENDRVIFNPDQELAPGNYSLELKFTGKINEPKDMRGFYQTRGTHGITCATQFESTNARMVFACVDQPGFENSTETPKAKYRVSLTVPEDLAALSVGEVICSEQAGPGFKQVQFSESTAIPSYICVFIVGKLVVPEAVIYHSKLSGKDIPIRVWCEPGQENLVTFALDCAKFSLGFYEDLFKMPYQAPALNMVALKDFMFGAMENHCSHTFREAAILADASTASLATLKRIAEIVAHEIGHNWYGNLVTMSWWHGVTAKEMMATFVSHLCIDAWKPEFEMWNYFLSSRAMALSIDGLKNTRRVESPVGSPDEAESMYDALTYEKGCALNYMLLQYLGLDTYARGCQIYLSRFAFGNADLPDFWAAMSEASGQDIEAIMPAWFHQPGVPAIYLSENKEGILAGQLPFQYLTRAKDENKLLRDRTWQIPLVIGTNQPYPIRLVLGSEEINITLPKDTEFINANANASGYYRVFYDARLLKRLLKNVDKLSAAEQYTLLNDLFAGVKAGKYPLSDYINVLPNFKETEDANVWSLISDTLYRIKALLNKKDKAQFIKFVRTLVTPLFERLGYESPESENPPTGELRAALLGIMVDVVEDKEVIAQCRSMLEYYLADSSSVAPDLVAPIIFAVARSGNKAVYREYLRLMEEADSPQAKLYFTYALSMFPDKELVTETLNMALDGKIRAQNAFASFSMALNNASCSESTWRFILDNWARIENAMPSPLRVRIVKSASSLSKVKDHKELKRLVKKHPITGFELQVKQCLEQQEINVEFVRRQKSAIRNFAFPESQTA